MLRQSFALLVLFVVLQRPCGSFLGHPASQCLPCTFHALPLTSFAKLFGVCKALHALILFCRPGPAGAWVRHAAVLGHFWQLLLQHSWVGSRGCLHIPVARLCTSAHLHSSDTTSRSSPSRILAAPLFSTFFHCISSAPLPGHACLQTCQPELRRKPVQGPRCSSGSLLALCIPCAPQQCITQLRVRRAISFRRCCQGACMLQTCQPVLHQQSSVGPAAARAPCVALLLTRCASALPLHLHV